MANLDSGKLDVFDAILFSGNWHLRQIAMTPSPGLTLLVYRAGL
jgi:hypothetical protein